MENHLYRLNNIIAFVGSPGAGKGRLSESLRKIGYVTFTASEIIDAHGSAELKKMKAEGKLIPDTAINSLMFEHTPKRQRGLFLGLDGWPRTIEQSSALLTLAAEKYGNCKVITLFIDTPEEVAKERALGRGRDDDKKVAAMNERFESFKLHNPEVIGFLEERTHFYRVDGLMSPEAIDDYVILEVLNRELSVATDDPNFDHNSPDAKSCKLCIPGTRELSFA